ncbi:SAM-dependent methyltransferase [Actinoalloteichus sp. AHMU CJ021]|uniref:class I SAM-dependent methyltransferase n=1 Tax=Actinoalloteichus sp. AHMU CJ021 TaxID=2072503 RepID=UPI000CA00A29|nr:SAM-dependent methyltransferase [Actinoalloteichus sp. AHMU CJ021]
MYAANFAEVYELIYRSRGKSWAGEAEETARLIRARNPSASSLLDVACGTGAHLETFGTLFDHVEGLEIAKGMRTVARERLPGVSVHAGDMRDFDLNRTFDAACCMFNSIAYLTSVADMSDAVRAMGRHLAPGGVLVIEPWWFPERFIEGYVAADAGAEDGKAVVRMSHSTREGDSTRLEVRFMVGDADGIREFTQTSMLRLFTKDEYLEAFAAAGCPAEYLEGGLTGRGLFIGVRE